MTAEIENCLLIELHIQKFATFQKTYYIWAVAKIGAGQKNWQIAYQKINM